MLFLSCLLLDTRDRLARRDLARPYEMHRTLWRAFPGADEGGPGRVLFRVDADREGNYVILVQSEKRPDWDRLPAGYLAADPDVKSLDGLRFTAGQRLRFRLRANPTRKVNTLSKAERLAKVEKRHGTRVAVFKEDQQIEWLVRHGEVHNIEDQPGHSPAVRIGGFRLLRVTPHPDRDAPVYDADVRPSGWVRDKKEDRRNGKVLKLTHLAVLFEGVLEVTDPAAFANTLAHGIGPAKGLGFGLLSVAPAGRDA
jgi:CRISPR system Cascade subunit CasE